MKARKILSALLAAAVMTSTAVYAEEVSTEEKTMVTVTGEKGTETLGENTESALRDALIKYWELGEGDTIDSFSKLYVVGEGTQFSLENCNLFDVETVYNTYFELLHIDTKDDGTMEISDVVTAWQRPSVSGCWWYVNEHMGEFAPEFDVKSDSITYDSIYELMSIWTGFYAELENSDLYSEMIDYDNMTVEEIKKARDEISKINEARSEEMLQSADLLVLHCQYSDLRDEYGMNCYKYFVYNEETGSAEEVVAENAYQNWCTYLTENGAKKLANLSADNKTEDTVTVPTKEFEVKEAMSSDNFAELLSANAEADVTLKTENGISFTFKKGEMKAVDGVDSYDFSSVINTTYDAEKNSAIDEKDFVLSVDYGYSGKLPAKASVTIPVGKEYAGKTLYYSQILESGVKLITSAVVDTNGNITVTQDHCSEYVLSTTNPDPETNPETGITLGFAAVAIAVSGVLVGRKKR